MAWIKWQGTSADKTKKWEAEAESYESLYHVIIEKYGHNEIVLEEDYLRALLVANGESEDKFDSDNGMDMDLFDGWSEQDNIRDLNADEYKNLIESSTSNAYYHSFSEGH